MEMKVETLVELYSAGLLSAAQMREQLGIEEDKPYKVCSSERSLLKCPFCGSEKIFVSNKTDVKCMDCGCFYMYIDEGAKVPDCILEDHQTCDECYDLYPNEALTPLQFENDGLDGMYCPECYDRVLSVRSAKAIADQIESGYEESED